MNTGRAVVMVIKILTPLNIYVYYIPDRTQQGVILYPEEMSYQIKIADSE